MNDDHRSASRGEWRRMASAARARSPESARARPSPATEATTLWRRRANSREREPPRDAWRKPARVGGQRSAKPGSELRRSPLPANLLRGLDDEHASPGFAERRRGDEAIGRPRR